MYVTVANGVRGGVGRPPSSIIGSKGSARGCRSVRSQQSRKKRVEVSPSVYARIERGNVDHASIKPKSRIVEGHIGSRAEIYGS